jgi:cytochrome c oxidase assembly protein subunit 15
VRPEALGMGAASRALRKRPASPYAQPVTSSAPRDPLVGAWLLAVCALVIGMIVVGGATRLTDSGLSITEWDFAKHFVPPLTQSGWEHEFALYQRTTEYQVQNRGMALDEFRFIYLWEWGHRFLGQTVGIVFTLPYVAFLALGRLKGRLLPVTVLGLLGGAQGAVGWWMVTSGLYGALDVSAVRLAVHLGMAFAILALGWRLALGAFHWPQEGTGVIAVSWRWAFFALVFAQILAGALVAGTDAGRAFGDWPTIGGRWIPVGYDPFDLADLASVQFTHRMLGYAVLVCAAALVWVMRAATGATRTTTVAIAGLCAAQAALGIATILIGAPLWISLAHQFGAVAIWLAAGAWMQAQTAKGRA